MDRVIYYLKLKNQYFEKFHKATTRFIEHANEDRWDEISFFVDNRERILNIIHYFDVKIAELFQDPEVIKSDVTRYQAEVKALLDEREEIAGRIIDLDLELISKIDDMKSETISELKKTLETKQQLNSFSISSEPLTVRKPTKSA